MKKPEIKSKGGVKRYDHPGQPTKYDPKYCQMVVEHVSQGYSFPSFAAIIGVAVDTLYAWEHRFPEFSEAKKKSLAKNLLWWEKAGHAGMYATKEAPFNATVWIFSMKNRHGWVDRQEIDTTHTIKPLKQEYEMLNDAELLKLEEAEKKVEEHDVLFHEEEARAKERAK